MRPRAKTEAFFPALLMGPSQSVSVLLRFLDNELDIVSADELDTCIASIYYEEIVACASGRQRLPPNEGPVERLDIRFTPTDEPITQTREVRFMVNSATACRECRRLLNERCEAARGDCRRGRRGNRHGHGRAPAGQHAVATKVRIVHADTGGACGAQAQE